MRRLFLISVVLLAGCSSHYVVPSTNVAPQSVQRQTIPAGWTYLPLKRIGGLKVSSIGLATDTKKMWVTALSSDGLSGDLDKVAIGGRVTPYPLNVAPSAIALGSDGNFWLTTNSYSGVIAQVTPAGQETDFTVAPGMGMWRIISGSDGALWFTECSSDFKSGGIGRVDLKGSYTFYPSDCQLVIGNGPDGNIWFGDGAYIYAMTTQGESLGQYATGDSSLGGMATGSDGAMYFTAPVDLVRVTTDGTIVHLGNNGHAEGMYSIVNGPDGNLWITTGNHLIAFNPKTSTWVARVKSPSNGQLLIGPDSNIWKTDNDGRVDRYALN